jgi:hypothetical protein
MFMLRISEFKNLKERVYATLVFFDLFDRPLTLDEIYLYRFGNINKKELENFLQNDHQILLKEGLYFFADRKNIFENFLEKQIIARKLWHKVGFFLPIIRLIPFVRLVAICNTLAFDAPTLDSDIDLFIITKKGRIFLTRTFVTLLFSILGVRRHGNKIAGRFCLSFYLADDVLDIHSIQLDDDIYLPFWMASLKAFLGKQCYLDFLKNNNWLTAFFDREPEPDLQMLRKDPWFSVFGKFGEFVFGGKFGDLVELKLKNFYQKRFQKNKNALGDEASIVVNSSMLKFHNIDRRKEITESFKERFNEVTFRSKPLP